MNDKSTYMKFLQLAQVIRGLPTFPALDAVEDQLLHIFGSAWATGQRITVLEAMKSLQDTSESTVFRRLKSLRAKGMLNLEVDQSDHRTKYVVPTDKTLEYFSKMGECLILASRDE